MSEFAHKGQILPLVNQMIPIEKTTTFHASYDYGLHGINQGEAVHPIGWEYATDFDGSTGYISVDGLAEYLHGKTEATIEGWVHKKSLTYGFLQLSGFASTNGNIYPYTTNKVVYLDIFRTNRLGPITLNTPATEWHHFAITAAPGENGWKLYQNGELVYQGAGQDTISTNYQGFEIGRNSKARYADGTFSNLRVWSYARSANQIKDNMHKVVRGQQEGLVASYQLGEREGPIAYDLSGNGYDGVWNGGVSSKEGELKATLQKGKFGKGVFIEKATTNLVPVGMRNASANFSNQSSATYTLEKNIDGRADVVRVNVVGTADNNAYAYFGITNALTAAVGTTVTVSFEYKIVKGPNSPSLSTVYADGFKVPDATNQATYSAIKEEDVGNGWKRESRTCILNAVGNTYFRFNYYSGNQESQVLLDNFQIEYGEIATSFVDGARAEGLLSYPIEVLNHAEGTLSFWMKHPAEMPYTNGTINDAYVSTSQGYTSTGSLVMAKGGIYDTRILGIHWGGVNGSYVHAADELQHAPVFNPKDWNMITISWNKGVGYKYYINGQLLQDKRLGTGDELMPFQSDRLTFKNIAIDELRIEARQISDEEAAAWAASGLHYNYLDYSTYVD